MESTTNNKSTIMEKTKSWLIPALVILLLGVIIYLAYYIHKVEKDNRTVIDDYKKKDSTKTKKIEALNDSIDTKNSKITSVKEKAEHKETVVLYKKSTQTVYKDKESNDKRIHDATAEEKTKIFREELDKSDQPVKIDSL